MSADITPLRAFHGSPETKTKYLSRVAEHRRLDNLHQGYTGQGGKGCAVWCTLNKYHHRSYETELGIPMVLARLEDGIFEGLSVDDSKAWPEAFLSAIKPGSDLSLVWPQFARWLLVDADGGVIRHAKSDVAKKAIADVAALYARWIGGDKPKREEWLNARSAAAYAAAYAADAAAAAAYAADAAAAAAYAAYAAYAAAYAADAWRKARTALRKRQSQKLLELLTAAPVPINP